MQLGLLLVLRMLRAVWELGRRSWRSRLPHRSVCMGLHGSLMEAERSSALLRGGTL